MREANSRERKRVMAMTNRNALKGQRVGRKNVEREMNFTDGVENA